MPAGTPPDDDNNNLVATSRAGDNAEPFSVSEISAQLKRTVEDRFGFVRIRGELSGVKRAASGHLYANLKDDKARIDAVMWRGNVARLAFQPEDGLEVVANGKLTTYPGRSNYQIVIERMEVAGEGALLALLEKTRQRLAAEGLFDETRKRRLPMLPRTIGVVTSPTGSVIRDILHRLEDRFPSRVLVWPVLVQGKGSADQVTAAIRGFAAMEAGGAVPRPDVVIVARGGGSIEDLWGFNEEAVVRAISECPIPVISAVGHETDTTLADFAADRRAPTPTAAAEMAVPVRAELAGWIAELGQRQGAAARRPVTLGRERLQARAERLPGTDTLFQPYAQRLDDLADRLKRGLTERAAHGRERLGALRLSPALLQGQLREQAARLAGQRLSPDLVRRPVAEQRRKLDALARLAEQLHPDRPLSRGYVRVMTGDGATLTSAKAAGKADLLRLKFADGTLDAVPSGNAPSPRKAAVRPKKSPPGQEDLFG
ncbi:exodeoxyribonuclease VII large subunit [Pseudoblastomonas halimionae]|uniref:Exodeoxyribonuclease 7 large subunit n=1 Tax=Alteriqipengyuania halimionae TaxID=1926630 RepID=A0A6I4U3W0_9SPHN|nr:exodeoxyribonuclease VII large subunit [Alteriqipengyuania halimionae]MXP10789.1 exodeoxyribonuclease VII large subunit [Alteriqipengyuania halimionae]